MAGLAPDGVSVCIDSIRMVGTRFSVGPGTGCRRDRLDLRLHRAGPAAQGAAGPQEQDTGDGAPKSTGEETLADSHVGQHANSRQHEEAEPECPEDGEDPPQTADRIDVLISH